MENTVRLRESIKQARIVKEETNNPIVTQSLEEGLESLENALESLKEENE